MRWLWAITLLCLAATGALAQEGSTRLSRFLESSLSGENSNVKIEGFEGAFSSRATMAKLTISDAEGPWLTLFDAVLDWNRAAILRGDIQIGQLSAARIDLPRLPGGSGGPVRPEAGSFALPDLPVAVNIGAISVEELRLGEGVIGLPATLSVSGSAALSGGQGDAALEIMRLDGPEGAFRLAAGFDNATDILEVDLSLREAAGGLAATLLDLPGKPSVELTAKGRAPLEDFTADVALKTDGAARLRGQVGTRARQGDDPAQPARVIQLDIKGDLTPLFLPQYQDFFGPSVALASRASLYDDGRVKLDDLSLEAAALRLKGDLALTAAKRPDRFNLTIDLADPDGADVLLPLSGVETRLRRADLTASFDSRSGDVWTVDGLVQGVSRPEGGVGLLVLDATGHLPPGDLRRGDARLDMRLQGITLADPALAQAVGPAVKLGADLVWLEGAPLAVENLQLDSDGMRLTGDAKIMGLREAISVNGAMQAQLDDLSRLSLLAGQPLSGAISADLTGKATLLTGALDLDLTAQANDLAVGILEVDRNLIGPSKLYISARRDEDGLTLRGASVTAKGGAVDASGTVASDDSDLRFTAQLHDVGQFAQGFEGVAKVQGTARQDARGWQVELDGSAPNTLTLDARLLAPKDDATAVEADLRFATLAWVAPELAGPATLRASARQAGTEWVIDTTGTGPGSSELNASGRINPAAQRANLGATGDLSLALLNRRLKPNAAQGRATFDLRLDGPLAITSLRGQIRSTGARVALPSLRNALTGIDATVTLAGRNANVQASSNVDSGGRVSLQGRVGTLPPFGADLTVGLQNLRLYDPALYEARANGQLAVTGTVPDGLSVAGRVDLGETELRVPSTGMTTIGSLPGVNHVNEPAAVKQTRARAGLLGGSGSSGSGASTAIGLNVLVAAPNRIFVRGRGLDVELGGQVRLRGTTADVIPQGRFDLIRGRLNILGKRLVLEDGFAQLQGNLVPTLGLRAVTETDDARLFVNVEGPADAPKVAFTAEPDLPSDEVLARLLFGRSITSISAFQAIQLASAVATLAGQGGADIVGNIRNAVGIDDLDVTNDEDGGTTVKVGKYISDKAYTNVEIDSTGKSRVNLNLDITPNTTLRGQVGASGETGIGIFFEKDY